MIRVAGVVPTAGRSSRMGRPKALLSPEGRSFLSRVVHALREGGCDPVLAVVRDPGGREADEARRLGAVVVTNPDPGPGPISSLRAGLAAVPPAADGCAWCPVDYPLVRGETVGALVAAFSSAPESIVVPVRGAERGHPVIFPRSLFVYLDEPGLPEGARTVVRRNEDAVVRVETDDPGVLTDIDTPEELRRWFPGALGVQTIPVHPNP